MSEMNAKKNRIYHITIDYVAYDRDHLKLNELCETNRVCNTKRTNSFANKNVHECSICRCACMTIAGRSTAFMNYKTANGHRTKGLLQQGKQKRMAQ